MYNIKYNMQIGATESCKKIVMEETNQISQRYIKGSTKGCFPFDSWLSSKKSSEFAMDVGADIIGMVKTNTKVFFKHTI